MLLKYRKLMRFSHRGVLLLVLCMLPSFYGQAQQVVVEKSVNKVVIQGTRYYLHEVKQKETLFAICKAYRVTIQEVMLINSMDGRDLRIGQILRIPQVSQSPLKAPQIIKKEDANYLYHVVRKKETLYSLAREYKVAQQDIITANPGCESGLNMGAVIRIPKIGAGQKETKVITTPKEDKYYFYHKILPGETQYFIARKYGMKLRKLRRLNPELKSSPLKEGGWVKIPIALKPVEAEPVEKVMEREITEEVDSLPVVEKAPFVKISKIKLALLLPFYLSENDSINSTITFKDTISVALATGNRVIYPRSKNFIRFYQGMLIALDTLKKQGLSVDLHVYDTQHSVERVREIFSGDELSKVDLIVGPVYGNTFDVAADFAAQYEIPIVSPLSPKNNSLNNNPFVFQLSPSLSTICKKMAKYVTQTPHNQNLVVVHPKRYKHLNEYQLVDRVEKDLFTQGRVWSENKVVYNKISFDEDGLFGIMGALSDTCENVVLIPSTSQPIVDNIVTNLNVLSKSYRIRLMGFPVWQRYTSMDPENFYSLNLNILSPYYIDHNAPGVESFVKHFRNEFRAEPNDFSYRAYDLCLYFCNALSSFGKDFSEHLSDIDSKLLQGYFQFERVGNFGGFENRGFHIVSYQRDYQIHHAFPHWEEEPQKEVNYFHP